MAKRGGFNVGSFRSVVLGGNEILRTNKFLMEFTIPQGLFGNQHPNHQYNLEAAQSLEYYCEVTNMPGININAQDVRRYTYGPAYKRPFVTSYGDLPVTFYDDVNSKNFGFFLDWLKLINNSNLSRSESAGIANYNNNSEAEAAWPYEITYREHYVTDAKLYVFDNVGDISRTLVFRDIFPMSIADVPLSWSDFNSLLRMTVNFTYLEWYEEPVGQVQYTK